MIIKCGRAADEAAARTLRDWRRVAVLRVNVEHCNYRIYQQPSRELRQRYHHHAATVPAILCGGWQAQRMADIHHRQDLAAQIHVAHNVRWATRHRGHTAQFAKLAHQIQL